MRALWMMSCVTYLGCACAGAARAADENGLWYVNPQIGYTWVDDDRNVQDDRHYALGIGKHLSEHLSLELNGLLSDFDGPNGLELDIEAVSLDALLVFDRRASVSPFITFGAGYLNNNVQTGSGNGGVLGQAGLGLLIDVAQNDSGSFVFQLRPEARIRYDWVDRDEHDNFRDYLANLGLVFNFGAPRSRPAAPVARAPEPPPVAPARAPERVVSPAPRDADGDGVVDDTDQCPGTPRGTAINSVGCPRGGAVTLHGVGFELNSAALTPASRPILDEVAADLRKHPRLRIELQGHTDSLGSEQYNLQLSQRRADAVRDYLVAQGVGANQLTARGYGETKPIADNSREGGRVENRRVVMTVIDNPGEVDVKGEERDF